MTDLGLKNRKKLMILGASSNQLPAIRRAVELGHYVITADYLPENVGHKFSHAFVNCSTVEKEGILDAASELAIDGIMTSASDVATSTVGFVAERLNLPGVPVVVAETLSNKGLFRDFQKREGFHGPRHMTGKSCEELLTAPDRLTGPLVFKPVDSSGSKGVRLADGEDRSTWPEHFAYSRSFSRSGTVCVEEFVEGVDVSGDGFLSDGRLWAVITAKHTKNLIPVGHSLPTGLAQHHQELVLAEVSRHCRAIGYREGPLDFDVRVTDQRAVVLEMSPRLGGNGIPTLIRRATGFDLIEATIRFALGERVLPPGSDRVARGCGSWIFGVSRSGILENIASSEAFMQKFPEVFDCRVNYSIGDRVPKFENGGACLGQLLFDLSDGRTYDEIVARLWTGLETRIRGEEGTG